ncbi:MAG TPA: cytochrome c peroxidase [Thermoanaerobaculia bacterium]|nr:cytochrome c peroxidase [Thermoanaerobaculia bacterium]
MTRRTFALATALFAFLAACASRPAASEFGPGPRKSAQGLYTATLVLDETLTPRKMYTVRVSVTGANGAALPDAAIAIDGGMPQHGHGLPTRPRITRNLGEGQYEIGGLRFNMSGWWELELTITTPAGADTVTFNLDVGKQAARSASWTPDQIEELRSMSLGELGPVPADPSNRFADDPRAAQLGKQLFFDTRLSSNGKVSCATCHLPDKEFQDGTALAKGVGTTDRRTMPIAGTAYAPFLFWDGRKDSQWAQALGPLESPVEHGGKREQYAKVMEDHYRDDYEAVFGPMPDDTTAVFVHMGKSIAAFERTIQYEPSRFDRYVDLLVKTGSAPENILTEDEVAGLRLFTGKANCTQCHNGPLLTNNEFHNTGVPAGAKPDRGRIEGSRAVMQDEFNCRSKWSDAKPEQCAELDFLAVGAHEQERAFKVPSLRNVAERAPYMHAGQFATLDAVVAHYNAAPAAPAGHSELKPLSLNAREIRQLTAFLRALSAE